MGRRAEAKSEFAKAAELKQAVRDEMERKTSGQHPRPKYSDALKRAEDLDRWHDSRDPPGANPSTTAYKLVERIKAQDSSQ